MTRAGTLLGNAFIVLTSDVANRAATFVVYALVARHLGATDVGQLALALSLFYAFQVFAAAGVRTVMTREIATNQESLHRQVWSATLLVAVASAVSVAVLAGVVRAIGYSHGTAAVVLVLGVALLPYALSVVCEAVFQAFERMRYIAYAQVPVHVARVALTYVLLRRGYGVYQVAMLLLASHVAVASVGWCLMYGCVMRPQPQAAHSPRETLAGTAASALDMARSARTFLGIDGLIAIGAVLNVVLLSALAGEKTVGLYSAASQVMIPVTLVYQSVVISVFPMLCRMMGASGDDVVQVLSRMLDLLLALAIPTAVGLFFLSDSVLVLLYGEREFLQASAALRVMVWTLVPVALTSVLGQIFLAGGRETVTLRIVAVNLLVAAVTGIVLIWSFGLIGAAIAAVLAKAVSLWQHYRPVSRLVPRLSLQEVGWKPAVAGACMAIYLAAAGSAHAAVTAASAAALYVAVLLALTVWTTGGPRRFRAALSDVWLSRRQI